MFKLIVCNWLKHMEEVRLGKVSCTFDNEPLGGLLILPVSRPPIFAGFLI